MKIIDFRFRPHTEAILNGIKNSTMFKASCEASGFDKWQPQTLDDIVADLRARGVTRCVITGRDCRTTYGFPDNNGSVLEFCRAYPNKFVGFWGIDPHKKMAAVREIVKAEQFTTCGGDGGRSICGGLGMFLGYLPCSPHCKPEVQEDKELNGDYDFYRPIIRVELDG